MLSFSRASTSCQNCDIKSYYFFKFKYIVRAIIFLFLLLTSLPLKKNPRSRIILEFKITSNGINQNDIFIIDVWGTTAGLGNLRPVGHMQPANHFYIARELHLKFSLGILIYKRWLKPIKYLLNHKNNLKIRLLWWE